ncbi:flavin reductase [Plantactinospora sp. BC1]|nr:flavin reductase [Plantactinospora sp. BC1]
MTRPHAPRRPHTPMRPSFRCRACGAEWPCSIARRMLLHVYRNDRTGLLIYLAAQLTRAIQDLPGVHPALLAGRIVYWVPRNRAP